MKLFNRMKRLILDQITGFRNITGGDVIILDERYVPFYDTRIVKGKVWKFNLPPGIYYVAEGKIAKAVAPIEYTLDKLPPPTRNLRGNPETFPVYYGKNNYSASVFWDKERSPFGKCAILMDKSLRDKPKPEQMFIYYHECAHKFYNDSPDEEAACDLWAKNRMLAEGYNPSQIGVSIVMSLSPQNEYRVNRMIKALEGL